MNNNQNRKAWIEEMQAMYFIRREFKRLAIVGISLFSVLSAISIILN